VERRQKEQAERQLRDEHERRKRQEALLALRQQVGCSALCCYSGLCVHIWGASVLLKVLWCGGGGAA
jgi:hypothetical protein